MREGKRTAHLERRDSTQRAECTCARALLSAPFRLQQLAFHQPTIAILTFPFILRPAFVAGRGLQRGSTIYQLIIRKSQGTGGRELIRARRGLIPFFIKDQKDVRVSQPSTRVQKRSPEEIGRPWLCILLPVMQRSCLPQSSQLYLLWDPIEMDDQTRLLVRDRCFPGSRNNSGRLACLPRRSWIAQWPQAWTSSEHRLDLRPLSWCSASWCSACESPKGQSAISHPHVSSSNLHLQLCGSCSIAECQDYSKREGSSVIEEGGKEFSCTPSEVFGASPIVTSRVPPPTTSLCSIQR